MYEKPTQPNIKIMQLMRPIKAETKTHRGVEYLFAATNCGKVIGTIGDMGKITQPFRLTNPRWWESARV